MSIPLSFQSLVRDPAPGLVFSANDAAGVGRRTIAAPHGVGPRAGWLARRAIRSLVPSDNGPLEEAIEFFYSYNGLSLCVCPNAMNPRSARAAISFLPVSAWDAATATAETNDEGRLFAGVEDIYRRGGFRVIATSPSEGTLLTLLLEDGYDAHAKAGSIYYLSLRPACDRLFPFAPSLGVMLDRLAANPASFFHGLGFTGQIQGPDGVIHPDLIETYVPDVRARADAVRRAA